MNHDSTPAPHSESPPVANPVFGAAEILWRDERTPFSPIYGDVYFSQAGGVAEKRAVFVEGCGLPERFAEPRDCRVLELGFGTGLGFLVTAAAFLAASPVGHSRLWFYSIEKHPWRPADFARLAAQWPEFSGLAAELVAQWPDIVPGFHRRYLAGGRIVLTWLFGEARAMLDALGESRFDAVYLDGFSPARNQAMWTQDLCAALRAHAVPGARLATYSAARPVADALRAAGFVVHKQPGFAGKRHRLLAIVPEAGAERVPARAAEGSAVVIGAGIAGLSAAYALARRGRTVQVFDAESPGSGASGNPAGLLTPLLTVDNNLASQLVQMGLGFARAQIAGLQAQGGSILADFTGAVQWVRNLDDAARQQRLLAQNPPDESLAVAGSARDLAERTGLAQDLPGWWYPGAGWVAPKTWLAALAATPGISLQCGQGVAALRWDAAAGCWHGLDSMGVACFATETLILATGAQAVSLLPELADTIFPCRGQVNISPQAGARLPCPVMREGYLVDLPSGERVYGASFKRGVIDTSPSVAETEENRLRLGQISPSLLAGMPPPTADAARVSLRATTRSRLPLVGAHTPPGAGALWLSIGHGSRGLVTAPLCGEHLAALIGDEPAVLPEPVARALAPRYRLR
ncbi:FAD-dependent 5-carboxymethylaminomethyl-2-thiouridine(34) oxidoreductase MnmC [Halothiobacillus sp. DCM-1]|uniref:FAD-dependent 5-carboxymethylaminomethyl-2-thiouridine(34) oxidoreductase MnmC n=1 Tax=Halothiobacillus sp. DCM-1 TaxID=3112558 RepID=UPI003250B3A5